MFWPRAVIHRLAEKIQKGTKFFIDHGKGTNSHEGRRSVGEIITSYVKDIGGKLSSIIIGHFPDETEVKDMDVCSVEAEVYTDDNNLVGDIDNVTGIALGNSSKDHPAFMGARRLGMVQCFEDDQSENKPGEGTMTFDEVKKAIRDMNIHPWQIFSEDDLKNDREFGKLFENNSTLVSENERLTKENKELTTKSQEAISSSEKATALDRLQKRMAEGYTDTQKKFIEQRFNPDQMENLSDESLDNFLKSTREDFSKTAKLFGVAEKDDASQSTESDENEGDKSKKAETILDSDELVNESLKEMGVS